MEVLQGIAIFQRKCEGLDTRNTNIAGISFDWINEGGMLRSETFARIFAIGKSECINRSGRIEKFADSVIKVTFCTVCRSAVNSL
jgi:hypothetical protein